MPLSEEMIERVVERRTDSIDKKFMNGKSTKAEYEADCAAIAAWADRQYAMTRCPR